MNHRLPCTLLVAVPLALLLLPARAPSSSTGIWFTWMARDILNSLGCGNCHEPNPGSIAPLPPLRVQLEPTRRVLAANESIAVTIRSTGGQTASTQGGFCAEATAGTLVNGAGTKLWNGALAITHDAAAPRSWTFGFVAPPAPGLVELYGVVNTVDGNQMSGTGDFWASHGFDGTQNFSTPVCLYVNATGVAPRGSGCAGSFDNVPVLGAKETPSVGNASFGFELHGAAPSALALLVLGANPQFPPIDLTPLGASGCTLVVDPTFSFRATTSAGVAARGDGSAGFALPLPSDPALRGFQLQSQAVIVDLASARALPLTLTNGLDVTVQ